MKLVSAITLPSGMHNEDALGFIERDGEITAAWVIDGVTGINTGNILSAHTDAIWIVERVQKHLHELAASDISLQALLSELVSRILSDWRVASQGLEIPDDHDLPACCLLIVKKTDQGWNALRLGDSFLLTRNSEVRHHAAPVSNLIDLEAELQTEVRKRRDAGQLDIKVLTAEFAPLMLANRSTRNRPGGYSIVEPHERSLFMPQFMTLGRPHSLLLCTDGFYRCVDYYGMFDDAGLMAACQTQQGAAELLQTMRGLEDADAGCQRYPRFKPRDDATVVVLGD